MTMPENKRKMESSHYYRGGLSLKILILKDAHLNIMATTHNLKSNAKRKTIKKRKKN